MVHVVYGGKNEDLELDRLFPEERREALGVPSGSDLVAANLSESMIKKALASHYDVAPSEFNDHFVENNPNGNITVRPSAVWG